LVSLPTVTSPDEPFIAIAAACVLFVAVAVLILRADARARWAPLRAWAVWGAAWFALATATLASIFPSWQPNRSQYGSMGLGVAAVALTGAAHPGLAAALSLVRLAALERAPGATRVVNDEPIESGAFMDYARLTRLQHFMRAARLKLTQRWRTLPRHAVIVQQNLPHGVEYAFGGSHALQVWYRDSTLSWLRFDAFRARMEQPVWTILQGEGGHEPPVALVEPEAMRSLFAAQALVRAEDFDRLLPLLDRADSLQRDPHAVSYRVTSGGMRGYAFTRTGRHIEAESLVRPLVALLPTEPTVRQVLTYALAAQGRLREAYAEFDTVRALDPDSPATRSLRSTLADLRAAAGARR
ncbi:MAG: tetratricopeptide repeat protein, partial [Candidatus Eisenbacteria bacterium]